MVQIIRDSIKDWGSNDDVQCVVYESAPRGGKAFCAGGDVRAVYEAGKGPFPENDRGKGFGMPGCVTADFFRHEYQMNHAIATLGKPQVAVWDGIVMGGGVGLTAHGKYRIATERALFAMPETAIGLFPDVGMTYALPRLQPPPSADGTSLPAGTVGRYLGLTGARLKGGADLLWSGLATHSLHSSQLPAMHEALTNPSLQGDSVGAILDQLAADAPALLAAEAKNSDAVASKKAAAPLTERSAALARCFGPQHGSVESMVDALRGEVGAAAGGASDEDAAWAAATLKLLAKESPTSLKITLEALHRNGQPDVTLGAALAREFGLVQHCLQPNGDFYEGVRSVLVDKGKGAPPAWQPDTLEQIDDAKVASFFEPLDPSVALELPRRQRGAGLTDASTTVYNA
jgi:enoyl-CoA hydratase/carnithine racemase